MAFPNPAEKVTLEDIDVTFVRTEGERSANIALLGNDLRGARLPIERAGGFVGDITKRAA